jgi:hypothetical protein
MATLTCLLHDDVRNGYGHCHRNREKGVVAGNHFLLSFCLQKYCEDCIISNDKAIIIYNLSLNFRNPLRKNQVRLCLHRLLNSFPPWSLSGRWGRWLRDNLPKEHSSHPARREIPKREGQIFILDRGQLRRQVFNLAIWLVCEMDSNPYPLQNSSKL